MAVQAFLLGFAAALLTLAIGLAVLLLRLKRKRAGRLAIRGIWISSRTSRMVRGGQ